MREKTSRSTTAGNRIQTARSAQSDVHSDRHICLAAFQEKTDEHWYLDSAASIHMTGNTNNLDWHLKTKKQRVILANGDVLHSTAVGGVILPAVGPGEGSVDVKLNNVVVVPGLSTNLVSVEVITRLGYTIIFNSNDCKILKDGEVVVVAQKFGCLYRLNM